MNTELERTEELIAVSKKKNKKTKIMVAGVLLAIVAMGAGIFAGIMLHEGNQVGDKLMIAQKYLEEGKYEQAIEAFDEVIKLDDKNADAYEGLGMAYLKNKQPDKAKDPFIKAIKNDKNIGRAEGIIIEVAAKGEIKLGEDVIAAAAVYFPEIGQNGLDFYKGKKKKAKEKWGCTPENFAAGGIVCEKGDELYIANKPKRGDITKVDAKGKEKKIFSFPDIGEKQSIEKLNVWDGWVYFTVYELKDIDYTDNVAYKVKEDDSKTLKQLEIDNLLMDMSIINGKIYYQKFDQQDPLSIFSTNLDGKELREIAADSTSGGLTFDEQNIYYNSYADEQLSVKAIGLEDFTKKTLSKDEERIGIAGNVGNNLYGVSPANARAIMKMSKKGGDGVNVGTISDTSAYNLDYESNMFCWAQSNDYNNDKAVDGGGKYNITIIHTSLKNGKETGKTSFDIDEDVLFPADIQERTDSRMTYLDALDVVGDRIYYKITRYASVSDSVENLIGNLYGSVKVDGTDNQIYDY